MRVWSQANEEGERERERERAREKESPQMKTATVMILMVKKKKWYSTLVQFTWCAHRRHTRQTACGSRARHQRETPRWARGDRGRTTPRWWVDARLHWQWSECESWHTWQRRKTQNKTPEWFFRFLPGHTFVTGYSAPEDDYFTVPTFWRNSLLAKTTGNPGLNIWKCTKSLLVWRKNLEHRTPGLELHVSLCGKQPEEVCLLRWKRDQLPEKFEPSLEKNIHSPVFHPKRVKSSFLSKTAWHTLAFFFVKRRPTCMRCKMVKQRWSAVCKVCPAKRSHG